MSPLVRKEARSLLPPFLLAMLLAIVPAWLAWPERGFFAGDPGYLVYVPFALGVLLLSLTPFGQELNWGTFSILLAQPVARSRIWRVKTLLLALALLLVLAAFLFSIHLSVDQSLETAKNTVWRNLLNRPGGDLNLERMIADTRHEALVDSLMFGGLGALAGFAGGLWTTLLFRQVSPAFWFTVLAPLGLGFLTQLLGTGFTCVALGLYSAAGYFWARKQFQRVQDTQWTGGVVSLPVWGAAGQVQAGTWGRKRRELRALFGKELQIQYVNLLLAGGLLIIHLAVVLARAIGAQYLDAHRTLAMTLESFPVLWLAMPLLVGSVAIAEERKLGTFESISCVPISRRRQFCLKFIVALPLGFILGAVVPIAVERFGGLLGLHSDTTLALGVGAAAMMPMAVLSVIAGFGISLLAFYGSSFTRNTLQALGAGVLACIIAALLVTVGAHPPNVLDVYLWGARLLALILVPVMTLTLIVLAYRNFRHVQVNARVWRRNGLVLATVLLAATAVTSAVYHRFWEAWLPVEPPHSAGAIFGDWNEAARSKPATPKVQATTSGIAALLGDGRLWLQRRQVKWTTIVHGEYGYDVLQRMGRAHEGFAPVANWRDVAISEFGCYAIQADGSLWDLSELQPGERNAEAKLKRVGESRDWAKLAAGWRHHCALRSDGTLWEWGLIALPASHTGTNQEVQIPTQVEKDTDWIAIADSGPGSIAVKADGTIWKWGPSQFSPYGLHKRGEQVPRPRKWLEFPRPQRVVSLSFDGNAVAAVCGDGSLWFGGHDPAHLVVSGSWATNWTEMARVGNDSSWKQVECLGPVSGAALKQNGSLWKWNPQWWLRGNWRTPIVPLSRYPVWSSVCALGDAVLALGRDDTLCVWGQPHDDQYFVFNGPDSRRLLLPSRIQAREIANLAP